MSTRDRRRGIFPMSYIASNMIICCRARVLQALDQWSDSIRPPNSVRLQSQQDIHPRRSIHGRRDSQIHIQTIQSTTGPPLRTTIMQLIQHAATRSVSMMPSPHPSVRVTRVSASWRRSLRGSNAPSSPMTTSGSCAAPTSSSLGAPVAGYARRAHRLEREAADALRIAHNENSALLSKLNHLQTQANCSSGYCSTRSSAPSTSARSTATKCTTSSSECARSARTRAAGSAVRSLASRRRSTSRDWKRRRVVAGAAAATDPHRRQRGPPQSGHAPHTRARGLSRCARHRRHHLRAELTLLAAEKAATTNRLRSDLAYMTQLASETQAKLEAELVMARVDKESTVEALRGEMHQMMARHTAESEQLSNALREAERSKEQSELELRSTLRRQAKEHADDTRHLRQKIERLESVHREAMEAERSRGGRSSTMNRSSRRHMRALR